MYQTPRLVRDQEQSLRPSEKNRYRVIVALAPHPSFISPEDGGPVPDKGHLPMAYELARPNTRDESLQIIEEAEKIYTTGPLIHYARDTLTGDLFGLPKNETKNHVAATTA